MRRRFFNKYFGGNDYHSEYFTIEALEDGLTASLSANACEYRIDNGSWNTLSAGTNTPSINKGQTISFRGNLTPTSSNGIGTFTINKKCNLKGNIMSLLFEDNIIDTVDLTGKDYAFYKLFKNNTNIVDISKLKLPATTLVESCYREMFYGCTSLIITLIELPAMTLTANCYRSMFYGCTNLTTAPELPATKLANYCYQSIFNSCGITKAPELPATTLVSSCYQYMFSGCKNLTTAPELLATTLASRCYYGMFYNCTSLTTAPELPATTLSNYCYYNMFYNCTSLTTAPELPATTLEDYCYYGMFEGCDSLVTAPELPATTLEGNCYRQMFRECYKLNYIKMLATDINVNGCLYDWVLSVSSTGTFVKHPNMTSLPSGTSGIPTGWTVENAII